MSIPRIVTVDLDSTLCDTEHRFGLINREGGTDWHAYSAACVDDAPVEGIVRLVTLLHRAGLEVHALSGRKATAQDATVEWLNRHGVPIDHVWLDESDSGDYDTWHAHVDYKLARLREIEKLTGKKVVLHVDDWAGVAAAFEEAGIPTICVRTPFEIRDMVRRDASMDALK